MNKPRQNKSTTARTAKIRQTRFLKNLQENDYNITVACKKTDISRKQFYEWKKNLDFLEQFDNLMESRLDEWEQYLHRNIKNGDTTAVIFALKTQGRSRGYNEREPANRKVADILEKVLSGGLTPREAGYKINSLGMPLPEVLKLELSKTEVAAEENYDCPSVDELEQRAQAARAAVQEQREHFLPIRRKEVEQVKQDLQHIDSFGCNDQ